MMVHDIFFIASKLFWLLVMPANVLALCVLGAGLLWVGRLRVLARVAFAAGLVVLVVFGVFPAGHNMLHALESRIPQTMPDALPAHVDGILVLGGAVNTRVSAYARRPQFNEGAERITEAMILSHRYPAAKLVFSGGSGLLGGEMNAESDNMKKFLAEMEFDSANVIYETQSRNTYENIHNSFSMLNPGKDEVWILVTSAFHMPRSLEIARKSGWDVVPYPVDYRSWGRYGLWFSWPDVLDNLYASNVSMREIIGMLAYRLTGKI